MAQAILAGGCFWCTEAVFQGLAGVSAVESGYIGGAVADPSYKAVCTGTTGHAEAIRVTYDPAVVSYADLLAVHFATHDPTQLNRQGGDIGTQYRSAIFIADEAERAAPKPELLPPLLSAPNPWRPRSKARRHGIRLRTTIRNTGAAKASAIPIALR